MSEQIRLSIEEAELIDNMHTIKDETEARIKRCNDIYFKNRALKHIDFIAGFSDSIMNMSDNDIANILGIKSYNKGS